MNTFGPLAVAKRCFSQETIDKILRSESHFETLGMRVPSQTPDVKVMKAHYQKLVKEVHPDVCSHPRARDAFAKVQQAHEVLKDSVKARRHAAFVTQRQYGGGARAAWTGSAGHSAAKPAAGKWYRWLDEKFVMLKGGHFFVFITAALALQLAVSIVASAATPTPDQLNEEEEGGGGGERRRRGGGGGGGSSVAGVRGGREGNQQAPPSSFSSHGEHVPALPIQTPSSYPRGPSFSSDAGRLLVGPSREDVVSKFELRREANKMRQQQIMKNSPLAAQTLGRTTTGTATTSNSSRSSSRVTASVGKNSAASKGTTLGTSSKDGNLESPATPKEQRKNGDPPPPSADGALVTDQPATSMVK